ncbi:RraA family protein [Agrobacterium sp. NPDC089420]|uniref:RraA family protein n=1 Tax=Agrobacterium sp. NPDC089420 TaxID=3363918 RepID=UPI00384DB38A
MERWRQVPSAVVADIIHDSSIDPAIRPLRPAGQQPRLFGPALTIKCEGHDVGVLIRALDLLNKGDVLVIDGGALRDRALIGEILCGHARQRGAVGIVCDGAVRDSAELVKWEDFSVFSRFIAAQGPSIGAAGQLNVPVLIGGTTVFPGDIIIGDDDGLTVVRPEQLNVFIDAANAKLKKEDVWKHSLKTGTSACETFGLTPR